MQCQEVVTLFLLQILLLAPLRPALEAGDVPPRLPDLKDDVKRNQDVVKPISRLVWTNQSLPIKGDKAFRDILLEKTVLSILKFVTGNFEFHDATHHFKHYSVYCIFRKFNCLKKM